MPASAKPTRPEFRNINAFKDLTTYRMPLAALVSILHRVSGLIMFLLLPFIIWMFDTSISSEFSFGRFKSVFNDGVVSAAGNTWLPGWLIKLVTLLLLWAFLHHFFAGLRHLWSDVHHGAHVKATGRRTAAATLVVSIVLLIVLGAKLFGLY